MRMEMPGSLSRGAVWTHRVGWVSWVSLLGTRELFLGVFFFEGFQTLGDRCSLVV